MRVVTQVTNDSRFVLLWMLLTEGGTAMEVRAAYWANKDEQFKALVKLHNDLGHAIDFLRPGTIYPVPDAEVVAGE